MADKTAALSIVIRTVDQATAGINAVNKRLDELTKPARDLGEALGDLRDKSGLGTVADGFRGVGGAVQDLLGKVLVIGGAIGAAVAGVLSLVGEFDDLGDKAEAAGVSVDFLAQMRFAAERSGASVEQLDGGMRTLALGMGELRVGTGKFKSFIDTLPPIMGRQLKATKSNEEAFNLLANAMRKIQDPAKRALFAQKVFGDAALAPLAARGEAGISELRKRYLELAGSQEEAAAAASEVDDALIEFDASMRGVKAAIVTGLGPALTDLITRLRTFFSENRQRIALWTSDLGQKVPGAINKLIDVVGGIIDTIRPFIDSGTKLKVLAVALAGVIVGPLIASVYSLGVALLTTPVGWIVAGIAAIIAAGVALVAHWDTIKEWFADLWDRFGAIITAALPFIVIPIRGIIELAKLVIDNWEPISGFFSDLWGGITAVFKSAWDIIRGIVDKVIGAVEAINGAIDTVFDFINPFSDDAPTIGQRAISPESIGAAAGGGRAAEARVTVDFANAPRGMRVQSDPQSTADVDLSVGYQMIGAGA